MKSISNCLKHIARFTTLLYFLSGCNPFSGGYIDSIFSGGSLDQPSPGFGIGLNAPTSLNLTNVVDSSADTQTLTLEIQGVVSGQIVKIFTDSLCQHEIASGTVNTQPYQLSFQINDHGKYTFYAQSSDGNVNSNCSTVNVSHSFKTWVQQAYIKARNVNSYDHFGADISLYADTLAVGAPHEDSDQTTITNGNLASSSNLKTDSGAVYIYKRNGHQWEQEAYIKPSNADANDFFGSQVSLYENILAVSSLGEDSNQTTITNGSAASSNNLKADSGAVYLFSRTGNFWSQVAYIKSVNANADDKFGTSLSLNKNILAVGAIGEDSNQTVITNGVAASADNSQVDSGAVYLYQEIGGNWMQQAFIKAENTEAGDNFGSSIDLGSNTLVVSSIKEDSNQTVITNGPTGSSNNAAMDSGAVYVYQFDGKVWAQEAYIKPSNIDTSDQFGVSISLYNDLLAVGAKGEDSNETLIASGTVSSVDNSKSDSGAVYIFKRTGSTWEQDAYIKANNSDVSDLFGSSVSLFENTLVVGAPGEDSNQTTISNNATSSFDNTNSDSGAVYVYKRSDEDGSWKQQAYIKAINSGVDDHFGSKIKIHGKSIAIASVNESSNVNRIINSMLEASDDNSRPESGAVYVYNYEGDVKALITSGLPADITNDTSLNAQVGGAGIISYRYKMGLAPLDCTETSGYSNIISINTPLTSSMSSLSNGKIILCLLGVSNYGQQEYTDATVYSWYRYVNTPDAPTSIMLTNPVSSPGTTLMPTLSLSGYSSETIRLILYADESCSETLTQTLVSGTTTTITTPELGLKKYRFKAKSVDRIGNTSSCSNSYADYYYRGWIPQAYVKAANSSSSDYFGRAVSLNNDTLAVGAYSEDSSQTTITNGSSITGDNDSGANSGAVYVYKRTGNNWAQEAYIKAANNSSGDYFGYSVSLYNDLLVIGAYLEDSNQTTITNGKIIVENNALTDSGAVYVYKRTGNNWEQEAYIKAANSGSGDSFGYTVSLSEDTLAVGAYLEDSNQTTITNGSVIVENNSLGNSGAVYVYKRTGKLWEQEAYIKAANAGSGDSFGSVVSLSQDTLAVGAYLEDSNQTVITNGAVIVENNSLTDSGAVYVYKRTGSNWSQEAYIKATNAGSSDNFGSVVSLSQDTLAVGAYLEDSNQTIITNGSVIVENNSLGDSGAVYVYKRTGNNWSQEAYIKAANAGANDYFGVSVSIHKDRLVVGASREDSNQTIITNDSSIVENNSLSDSGAVYVYKRTGSNWSQEAYIKAANAGANDYFGGSVSIYNDTIAVGAYLEDSNQKTITNGNGAAADDSLGDSGAVYVYTYASDVLANLSGSAPDNKSAVTKLNIKIGGNGITSYRYKIGVAPLDCSDPSGYSSSRSVSMPITDNIYNLADGSMVLCVIGANSYGEQSYSQATRYEWSKFNSPQPSPPNNIVLIYPTASPGYVSKPTFNVQGVSSNNNVKLYSSSDCAQSSLIASGVASESSVSLTSTVPLRIASNTIYATQTSIYDVESDCSSAHVDYYLEYWVQQAYIKSNNSDVDDMFGQSIALSKNTLAVGAIGEDSNQTVITNGQSASGDNSLYNSGAVYIYLRNGVSWTQQAYIKPTNADYNDMFGYSVALDQDTLAVGAIYEDANQTTITNGSAANADNSLTDSGAVYVYKRTGTSWSPQAYIKAANAGTTDQFGTAISLEGNTLVVGAIYEDSNQTTITNGEVVTENNSAANSGAVYVYKRIGNIWAQEAYIKAGNADSTDYFGSALSLSQDTLAVGAYFEDSNQTTITNSNVISHNNSATNAGAVYVYKRTGNNWAQEAYIKASNANTSDSFGYSLSLFQDTLAVGAYLEDSNQTFITNGSMAASVDNSLTDSGAVYVYKRTGNTWEQEAYIKASNAGSTDYFGQSVSIHKDVLAVGAIYEDSSENTVVDPNVILSNNSLTNSGAVYLYQRVGSNWVPYSIIKAGNSKVDLQFGQNVAVDGTTVIISTTNESSSAVGVTNGTGVSNNSSSSNSGAVYVYQLEGRSQALISSGDPVFIGAANTALNIQVGGSGITQYRYKLGASPLDCSDASGYSSLISVSTPITDNLSGLADGSVTLCVVGVGGYGTQSYADATEYTWVKDTVVPSA
ncbi:MAG: FG-GAP repeat protein, partial [Pseudobdellovibrio sp.]